MNIKWKIICKTLRSMHHDCVQKSAENFKQIYKLIKRCKQRFSQLILITLKLIHVNDVVITLKEIFFFLIDMFFSLQKKANFSDIKNFFYSKFIKISLIQCTKIVTTVRNVNSNKILKSDEISNWILHAVLDLLKNHFFLFYNACFNHKYHLTSLRTAFTIALKKSKKTVILFLKFTDSSLFST